MNSELKAWHSLIGNHERKKSKHERLKNKKPAYSYMFQSIIKVVRFVKTVAHVCFYPKQSEDYKKNSLTFKIDCGVEIFTASVLFIDNPGVILNYKTKTKQLIKENVLSLVTHLWMSKGWHNDVRVFNNIWGWNCWLSTLLSKNTLLTEIQHLFSCSLIRSSFDLMVLYFHDSHLTERYAIAKKWLGMTWSIPQNNEPHN